MGRADHARVPRVGGGHVTIPLTVALTGGIGSGKTTVSRMFCDRGVPVIDADEIAREITRAGGPAFKDVLELFGPSALAPDGELRRDHIRRAVFRDEMLRRRLEAIIHPLVYAEIRRRLAAADHPYCVVSVPLLLESGSTAEFDQVLVVDVPEELQLRRTAERDRLPESEIRKVIDSQVSREARLLAADDVVRNDDDLDYLESRIDRLHLKYLALAESRVAGSS